MTLHAVVPAAGVGSRMGAGIPKQYLQLAGQTVIEQTLERLLQLPAALHRGMMPVLLQKKKQRLM